MIRSDSGLSHELTVIWVVAVGAQLAVQAPINSGLGHYRRQAARGAEVVLLTLLKARQQLCGH